MSHPEHTPKQRAPRVGCGRAPALLVIDFSRGWTEPESPFALDCGSALAATRELLDTARSRQVPVVFTTVAYDDVEVESVLMLKKTPRVAGMRSGSPLTLVESTLAPEPGEPVITKKHASAFFGTQLVTLLVSRRVDTLVICGCITSGCVRATAVDAAQHGYRALVAADACADRSAEAHDSSLRSIDELYGDVVTLAEAVACLAGGDRA